MIILYFESLLLFKEKIHLLDKASFNRMGGSWCKPVNRVAEQVEDIRADVGVGLRRIDSCQQNRQLPCKLPRDSQEHHQHYRKLCQWPWVSLHRQRRGSLETVQQQSILNPFLIRLPCESLYNRNWQYHMCPSDDPLDIGYIICIISSTHVLLQNGPCFNNGMPILNLITWGRYWYVQVVGAFVSSIFVHRMDVPHALHWVCYDRKDALWVSGLSQSTTWAVHGVCFTAFHWAPSCGVLSLSNGQSVFAHIRITSLICVLEGSSFMDYNLPFLIVIMITYFRWHCNQL